MASFITLPDLSQDPNFRNNRGTSKVEKITWLKKTGGYHKKERCDLFYRIWEFCFRTRIF